MKQHLLASVAALATIAASSAFAADLPSRKAPVYAPPPPMWTGFYAGLNAGYNFGTNPNVGVQNIAPPWTFTDTGTAIVPGNAAFALSGLASNTQSGFIGGGQVGYNYQYGSNILLGLEADIQGAGVRGGSVTNGAAVSPNASRIPHEMTAIGASAVQGGVDWLGTVRGRLGYLWTPTLLVYGTGGLAYGGAYANVVQTGVEDSYLRGAYELTNTWVGGGRQSQILTGWTAGGGAEWMFAPNWSLKAEALYWDLGRMNVQTAALGITGDINGHNNNIASGRTSVNYQGVMARAGLNYHFNWGGAPVAAPLSDLPSRKGPAVAPLPVWTAFYAGLNAGYNFGTNGSAGSVNVAPSWVTVAGVPIVAAAGPLAMSGLGANGSNTQSGFIGGGQIGYNYQYGSNILVGVEADIQGAGVRGASYSAGAAATGPGLFNRLPANNTGIGSTAVQGGVDWLGTVRGRIGYLWTPALLIYGTGGFAYGDAWANVVQSAAELTANGPQRVQSTWIGGGRQNQILTGWTAGGGAEWMFMPNWSLKTEALYWDLGRQDVQTVAIGMSPVRSLIANNLASGRTSVSYQGVIARAGVNYHFNWGAAPVVASY
jgi:outer membrane immunogenic protein